MNFPKSHPFAVRAEFDRVVAVSFAFPETNLLPFLPHGLEMDTYEGLGFLTVAMVWTRDLRPAGLPKCLGQDFFLLGYRLFTRLRDHTGRRYRGLKILRSETDRRRMVWLGNLLTDYRYRRVRLRHEESSAETRVTAFLPNGSLSLDLTFNHETRDAELPSGSPFPDWRTARQFAGPMPFTFSPRADGSFTVIEGSRQNWVPKPISVKSWHVGLFEESPLKGVTPILANAFMVENIPYRWSRGTVVKPAP